MTTDNALVLLSGGLDSTCAMHWAWQNFGDVAALFFDYGQPARLRELDAATAAAKRTGAHFQWADIANALGDSLSPGEHWHIPGRNAVLLSSAAAYAKRYWPGQTPSLVVGCNLDDATWHIDCQRPFLWAMSEALGLPIEAPMLELSKAGVVAYSRKHGAALAQDAALSWSCYGAGPAPCGTCPACELRTTAERTIESLAALG